MNYSALAAPRGFFRTKMTESPRRNILAMKRSLFTGLPFFCPLLALGISVHISFTYNIKFVNHIVNTQINNPKTITTGCVKLRKYNLGLTICQIFGSDSDSCKIPKIPGFWIFGFGLRILAIFLKVILQIINSKHYSGHFLPLNLT